MSGFLAATLSNTPARLADGLGLESTRPPDAGSCAPLVGSPAPKRIRPLGFYKEIVAKAGPGVHGKRYRRLPLVLAGPMLIEDA